MLTVGERIDQFKIIGVRAGHTVPSHDTFTEIDEKSFEGKWKVIVFYPKDFTFVCPTEIIGYDNLYDEFQSRNAELLIGSTDNEFSKLAWRDSHPDLKKAKSWMQYKPVSLRPVVERLVETLSSKLTRFGGFFIVSEPVDFFSEVLYNIVIEYARFVMEKLKNSDKFVGKFLTVSASVACDKFYAKRTARQVKIIKEAMFVFREILDLPKDLTIRLAYIKKRNRHGTYYHVPRVAELESRRSDDMDLLRTMAHELVHAEQSHTGRLKAIWNPKVGYVSHWFGEEIKNKGATYNSYRKQPWEVEAFDRQEKLAQFVASVIKERL